MDKFIVAIPKGMKKRKQEDIVPTSSSFVPSKVVKAVGVQMYLDFGQKSFGKSIQCIKCGLFYVVSDKEDQKEHQRFCRQFEKLPMLKNTTGFSTARKIDENNMVVSTDVSSRLNQECIQKVFKLMETDLGSHTAFLKHGKKYYFYLCKQEIVGVLIVDEVQLSNTRSIIKYEDFTIVDEPDSLSDSIANTAPNPLETRPITTSPEPSSTPSTKLNTASTPNKSRRSLKEPEVVLGVRMIWVHGTQRRAGLATRLLDTARSTLVYGYIYPVHAIAFTQCTEEGFSFAKKYCSVNMPTASTVDGDGATLCYDHNRHPRPYNE